MKPSSSCFHSSLESRILPLLLAFILSLSSAFISGCGGSASTPAATTPLTGYTSVTVLASSTANDRITSFNLDINGITLTSKSGATATLLATPLSPEFMHLNGNVEPIATASIPQDVYTAATVTVAGGQFTCITIDQSSGKLQNSGYSDMSAAVSHVTTTLPQPITVTGTSMGLALNLMVAASATFPSNCYSPGNTSFSITPNFSVTPVTLASVPTSGANGKTTSLNGQVASVDASGTLLNVTGPKGPGINGPNWPISVDGNTVFQGVSGVSQLTAGMPVEIDAALQMHGPMLATRVSVADTDTTKLNIFAGPVELVFTTQPTFYVSNREQIGYLSQSTNYPSSGADFTNARFGISSVLTNLQSLPFAATFNAANMIPGQNVSFSAHAATYYGGTLPAGSVTLMPQTVNGTVSGVSTAGGFTVYTVVLAPYDLIPVAAAQVYQVSQLTSPNVVTIYADANTQKLTTNPIAVGNTARFYGLLFNDNGTLRMDCAQINDGVAP